MDNENKRGGRDGGVGEMLPTVDSANRARNRTVMLTPDLTEQVRANLAGGRDPLQGGGAPHGNEGRIIADSEWDDPRGRRPALGSAPNDRVPGLPYEEEEEAEWARPIEPAIMSEAVHTNGNQRHAVHDDESASWQPPPAPASAPRVVRQQSDHFDQAPPSVGGSYSGFNEAAQPEEEIFWRSSSPLVGFLVTFDHNPTGSYVELHSGRLIVTSEREATGNCLVIKDASVSPMHAIMRVASNNTIQILDQLSENGTRIRRPGVDGEELLSGEKSTLSHGDVVIFGERKFHVCLLELEGV